MTPERLAEIRMHYEQRKSFIRSNINMSLKGAADLVERQANPDVRDLLAYVREAQSIIGDISGDIKVFKPEMRGRIRAFLGLPQSETVGDANG